MEGQDVDGFRLDLGERRRLSQGRGGASRRGGRHTLHTIRWPVGVGGWQACGWTAYTWMVQAAGTQFGISCYNPVRPSWYLLPSICSALLPPHSPAAPCLCRNAQGEIMSNPPLIRAITKDPVLSKVGRG